MLDLDSVLIVDGSRVMRHIMQTILRPYARNLRTAKTYREGIESLERDPDPTLMLCELHLPDGSGFDMLNHVAVHAPMVRVILMTTRFMEGDNERARSGGALAYLGKPISLTEVDRIWTEGVAPSAISRGRRVPILSRARLLDPSSDDDELLEWTVRNLSVSGAFIETTGPVSIGRSLSIEIDTGLRTIRVNSTVVRVQEPSWLYPGGIGVCFDDLDNDAEGILAEVVATAPHVAVMS